MGRRKKVDSSEEEEVDEEVESFRESMLGKRIEVQCLDDTTGQLEFYPCKVTRLDGDACVLEFDEDDDSDEEEEHVMMFPDFTLHDYDDDEEEEDFQVRRWRFARSSSITAKNNNSSLSHQAQDWAIQQLEEEEEDSFFCLHAHNTLPLQEEQSAIQEEQSAIQDLDAFSRGCKDVLMEYISISSLENFLNERSMLSSLIIPTALVVCENDYIEMLVCDRLEFELNDYIHVDGSDSMQHVLREVKSTNRPVILFTHCTRIGSLDLLLVNMSKLQCKFKLVFVVQSPDFLTKLGESVCAALDVCTFQMENSQSLFAHLLHRLVYSNRVNFSLPVFKWLIVQFDKYDFSIELFIKRVHYAMLHLLPEPSSSTELVQVIELVKLWGRHFRILPERDSSLVTKSLLVSGFRWKEIRLRVLASGQDTVEALKEMALTCLSAELFQAMQVATISSTAVAPAVARHKMGTKMRRIEGFKPASQTETSKQLCHYVDSLVAKHCRGNEDDALERAFTVVSWQHTLRSPMLQRSDTPDAAVDTDMELAYKLYTMVGSNGERDLDLYQWYQAFRDEIDEDDAVLQRFVQAICELKLCGVWDYHGKDRVKRLV